MEIETKKNHTTEIWGIFYWIVRIVHSYTSTSKKKRRKQISSTAFRYRLKLRCCVRRRIAILIRYILKIPSVLYWRSHKDSNSVNFIYWSYLLRNRSPFDCTRICGAQHVWKHRRTFFCWYYYQYSILGHS